MKKFLYFIIALFAAAVFFGGCDKKVDYLNYVSEKRYNIYLYSNDGLEIKIYLSQKEVPYCADGIKGQMSELCEIFVSLPQPCDEVEAEVGGISGQMNYRAVENNYYLSGTASINGERVVVKLAYGEKKEEFTAACVLYDGVISCDDAVKCAIDYDKELFKSLTRRDIFSGEIFVRLLYDEGCYYYVGVCDGNKKITAYLIDGVRGNIIATKQLGG